MSTRNAYRLLSRLNDARSIQRSIETGSPSPILKRIVRKQVYRSQGKYTRRFLRSLGL